MNSYFDAVFSVDEDEDKNIQSFSETPSKPVKPKDITEAMDETQQIQKKTKEEDDEYREIHTEEPEDDTDSMMTDGSEMSEETLSAMDRFEVCMTKIIPKKYLEYSTPAGVEISGCPGCSGGNADAADAAIIDAEITPVEKTVPDQPDQNSDGTSGGDDFGDMEDMDDSFGMMYRKYVDLSEKFNLQVSQEGLVIGTIQNLFKTAGAAANVLIDSAVVATTFVIKDVLPVAFKISEKARAILAHTITYVKNVTEHLLVNKSILSKVWKTKIKLYANYVNEHKLRSYKVGALDRDSFIRMVKVTVAVYDVLEKNADKLDNIATASKPIEFVVNELRGIGIKIDITNDKIDMSGLMNNRRGGDVYELGYDPDHIEICVKYCNEITSRLPSPTKLAIVEGLRKLHGWMNKNKKIIVAESKHEKITAAQRKKDIDIFVATELKIKFVSDVLRVIYHIWDESTTDVIKICEKYEKALLPKVIDD